MDIKDKKTKNIDEIVNGPKENQEEEECPVYIKFTF